ncbi:response regulator transcription factor [Microbacterium telephonicum]|uniref:Response regulator receiver domain-containing protein n=1 Tax=Microbacterium telephonicum TaxID=1714841 RepID=A0A498BYE4_9MICO|nr:response regulator [Microbacterium telephonicum]RLK47993.1 response regulator receiver domain-containing protein [Microbacterium telephonicum]
MADILVVDDDVDVARLLEHVLSASGHHVDVASDGGAGLVAARASHHHLVILDWMMPVKSGLDVCTELRADEGFSTTKIVMLTARATEADVERAYAAGADEYLTKPFSPRALRARIEELVA